jgi:hypothetical protein
MPQGLKPQSLLKAMRPDAKAPGYLEAALRKIVVIRTKYGGPSLRSG